MQSLKLETMEVEFQKKTYLIYLRDFIKARTLQKTVYGIGLALAKSIIKENNGYIDAENAEDNKGMRFIIKYYNS